MKFSYLKRAIEESKEIDCGDYKFNRYSFGEEGTYLTPELIEEIKEGLIGLYRSFNPDYLVSTEPGSNTWGLLLASEVGKPINIIRSANPRIPTNDNIYTQRTGYCTRN